MPSGHPLPPSWPASRLPSPPMTGVDGPARTASIALACYAAALAYATLHPWSGWRFSGIAPFAFLAEPWWPRWWTTFDVATNVALYLPLGLLAQAALARRLPPWRAALVAIALGSMLSLLLEGLQTYLPRRVPQALDWMANSTGATAGALVALALAGWWRTQASRRGWRRWLTPGAGPGVLLVIAWLVAQWYPQRLLFSTGEFLEPVLLAWQALDLGQPPALPRLGEAHALLAEALVVMTTLAAVCLLVFELLLPSAPRVATCVVVLGLAAVTNTMVGAWFLGPASALWWLSPGAQGGLVTGAVLAALLSGTSPRLRLAAIVTLLAVATGVANLAPPSGYFDSMLAQWDEGPLLNFNGLVRATAVIWPFAAIAWAGARLRATARGGPL